jgi:hypothetical protein
MEPAPAPALAAPEASGTFTVEPGSDSVIPAAGIELQTPATLLANYWNVPSLLTSEARDGGILEVQTAHPAAVAGEEASWVPAAAMAAFVGVGGRLSVGQEQRRRLLGRRPLTGERRGKTRYPCWLNSYCWPLGKPPIERCQSIAQDVSAGGVNLVLRRPFDEGTILITALEGTGSGYERCAVARVVHVLETAPGVWELGCVFDRVVDEKAVQELLLGGVKERAGTPMP